MLQAALKEFVIYGYTKTQIKFMNHYMCFIPTYFPWV